MFHQKGKSIAPFAAAEVLKYAFAWNNEEGRCFLVGKRAQSLVIMARFLERDEVADDIYDVQSVFNLIYGLTKDQIEKIEATKILFYALRVWISTKLKLPQHRHKNELKRQKSIKIGLQTWVFRPKLQRINR